MTNTREKLIELMTAYFGVDPAYYGIEAAHLADHIIANGVRLEEKQATSDESKWISVKDRFPTPYIPVLVCKQPFGGQQPFITVDHIVIGYGETKIWMGDIGTWKSEATHWMPLPQPPKGE